MSEPKRWKRSEYRRARAEYYRSVMKEPICMAQSRAEWDIGACDAVGYAWLPEEPELPGRLRLGGEGAVARVIVASEEFGGGHLFTVEGRIPAATVRAMVALWNAYGPGGDLRKRLEKLTYDGAARGFVLEEGDYDALLAKPWEGLTP